MPMSLDELKNRAAVVIDQVTEPTHVGTGQQIYTGPDQPPHSAGGTEADDSKHR
ncbi:hypothetical protein ACWGJ2_37145 [Streptomyces sp. NPDC054796]